MAKKKKEFDVDEIKEEANRTIDNYKGRKGDGNLNYNLNIRNLRIYSNKVLFLCKEINKLKKKLQALNIQKG